MIELRLEAGATKGLDRRVDYRIINDSAKAGATGEQAGWENPREQGSGPGFGANISEKH